MKFEINSKYKPAGDPSSRSVCWRLATGQANLNSI